MIAAIRVYFIFVSLVIQKGRGEMGLFNISLWQRSRFTLQWLIINLVGSLACLTAVALAQFEWSEGVSGSVSIPDVAFTCLGNLAVFMTAFTRGRLDVENGARDVLATTRGPKLNVLIDGRGLTTRPPDDLRDVDVELNVLIDERGLAMRPPNDLRDVDVVLLSKYNERPHSSLTQFMQYVSHSHDLESILLQVHPLESAGVDAGRCKCIRSKCRCVVFRATKKIMMMLARQLPGTLKQLPESQQCLLPSLRCLKNRCHGCDQDLLHVKDLSKVELACEYSQLLYVEALPDVEAAGESPKRWTSLFLGNPRVDSPAAVCEALNKSLSKKRVVAFAFQCIHGTLIGGQSS